VEQICQDERFDPNFPISRVEKGFEFLGYHYGRDGLSLASKTIDNFLSKALRLYEQEPVQTRLERLGEYTKRWVRWTTSGLVDKMEKRMIKGAHAS